MSRVEKDDKLIQAIWEKTDTFRSLQNFCYIRRGGSISGKISYKPLSKNFVELTLDNVDMNPIDFENAFHEAFLIAKEEFLLVILKNLGFKGPATSIEIEKFMIKSNIELIEESNYFDNTQWIYIVKKDGKLVDSFVIKIVLKLGDKK